MLFYLTVLIPAGALFAIAVFYIYQFRFWGKLGVPHTRPFTPLGDITDVCFVKSPGEVVKDLYDRGKNNPLFGIWFWFSPVLIVRDPEIVRAILVRDFMHFHDRSGYVNVHKDPLSGHLFSLTGQRWRALRPKLTPAFTTGHMKSILPKFVDCVRDLQQILEPIARNNGITDMREMAARFTTDTTTAYALGINSESIKNKKSIWREMGRQVFATTMFNVFRSLVPLFIARAGKILSLTPTPAEVSSFFLKAVWDIIQFREDKFKSDDYFNILIGLKNEGTVSLDNRNPQPKSADKIEDWKFTYKEAAAQAYIFFIAGFETSSLTIQYALYEMALDQNLQDRVRDEIMGVLKKYDGQITYEGLQEMNYLNRVLQETLRKYPVVPVILRSCTKTYQFPGTNVTIPQGTQVQISVYGMHWDPKYYPNPEKFDPDRFTEDEKSKRHNYAYLPFGGGPRNCIGMRFSILQKKVALVGLLSKFKFKVCNKTPIPQVFHRNSFFFAPKNGMHLQLVLLDK